MPRVAEVIIDLNLEKPLDYSIPENMDLKVGAFVEIPLQNRLVKGVVIQVKNESAFAKLKPIAKILDEALLPPDLMQLATFMTRYYLSPLRKVLKTIIPSTIREHKGAKKQFVVRRAKTLEETEELARDIRPKFPQQAEVLDVLLKTKKGIFLTELQEKAGCSPSAIKTLEKKGILIIEHLEVDRSPLQNQTYFKSHHKKLTHEQAEALNKIVESFNTFKVHLLFGVTGSGKTEVYLQSIDKVLARGESVIMLVPEISLTEQTIERFKSRFDEVGIAILHSRLSEGEKRDEWQRIKDGKASIVIGARSSVFAPLPNLGLIILDEEHEQSFKQSDESPRYHTRELAIMRGKLKNIPVILGSATPSLESFFNAEIGKFEVTFLKNRVGNDHLPKVHIIDMKEEWAKTKNFTLFSAPLIDGIKKRFERGEQTLLFLNRRGYHSCQICLTCGTAVKCRSCDTSLTFHKKEYELSCHLCNHTTPPFKQCPSCNSDQQMKFKGFGTEQVEASLKALFPEIRTLRMDADTTKHKGSHQKLFRDFGRGKADVLIGTQMIAKGLHFPEVTLVGVLNCDMSLHVPDFRASENTFQILTQVAGRAGRGETPGEVIFQTLMPDNRTIVLAQAQDYVTFYKEELESRKMFNFPPFSFLVKLSCRSENEKAAFEALEKLRNKYLKQLPPQVEWLPTVAAGHSKVKNIYKFNSIIKGPKGPIHQILKELPESLPNVKLSIDLNPQSTFF